MRGKRLAVLALFGTLAAAACGGGEPETGAETVAGDSVTDMVTGTTGAPGPGTVGTPGTPAATVPDTTTPEGGTGRY